MPQENWSSRTVMFTIPIPIGAVSIVFADRAGGFDDAWFGGNAHPMNQTNHVLLIAKGDRFAIYLNGQPLHYAENDLYRFGRCSFGTYNDEPNNKTRFPAIVAIDNLKIWNIADIPDP